MSDQPQSDNLKSHRLSLDEYSANFSDLHPPLTSHEAAIEASRCYFCYDAPCISACPTSIDIPLFIRQIASRQPEAAAVTILDSNILGGFCARVCPTETLCEEKCVREVAEGKPVEIGRLQRFATDRIMTKDSHPYTCGPSTEKHIAIVGSGPAGLACAHRLALHGNKVSIFEKRPKPGGLNEYGIAAYKTVNNFAQREISWLLEIGGITIHYDQSITYQNDVMDLLEQYDAVFIGIGLAENNFLNDVSRSPNAEFAVDFIEKVRQTDDYAKVPVGNDVIVIGGGMTAIDAAVQSKRLGSENVTIAYRRGREHMNASEYEQELALSSGVRIATNLLPIKIADLQDTSEVHFQKTDKDATVQLKADHILLAIGQKLQIHGNDIEHSNGKILTDKYGHTSVSGIWAGGDCTLEGEDLTVTAVAQGRDAAENIHATINS